MDPRFPVYLPTKTRFDSLITSRALSKMGVRHTLVVEEPELDRYNEAISRRSPFASTLVLDLDYKAKYDLCDGDGLSRSTGPGPARNFIWQHSMDQGYPWHWVMDDNIVAFYRLYQNTKYRIGDGSFFRVMEDFALRYENLAMCGPGYEMFVRRKIHYPAPYVLNTRIYSCNLIRNDVPFRWRGRYNEDTIMSLDMLKAGWCTVQFNAFLQGKVGTQLIKGGNTSELYRSGTKLKSEMLWQEHPDVSRLVHRYGRHHHHVDYSGYKHPLIRKPDAIIESSVKLKLVSTA